MIQLDIRDCTSPIVNQVIKGSLSMISEFAQMESLYAF